MKAPSYPVVGVVGSGTMGAGIASCAAAAGHQVLLYDQDGDRAENAVDLVGQAWYERVERGRMTLADADAATARLRPVTSLADLYRSGLVIEAIVEDLSAKVRLFADLENVVPADCVLATNTSSLSVTEIAAGLRAPARLVGLHFFNPVPALRLVEVVSGRRTDPGVAAWAGELVRGWGKTPVACRSTPGFIVNRVARPFYGEAFALLQERTADAATIDALLREVGGFPMGPLELTDVIGQDVNQAANRAVWAALGHDPRFRPSVIQNELVAAGDLGRKTGRGFYEYGPGRHRPLPVTVDLPGSHDPHDGPAIDSPATDGLAIDGFDTSGDPVLDVLVNRLGATGVGVTGDQSLPAGLVRLDGILVAVSDGRPAAVRARDLGLNEELVLLDLIAGGVPSPARIGAASSAGTLSPGLRTVAAALAPAGIAVSPLADTPGLVVIRTVAMLVNLALDAVAEQVAGQADIGLAMRLGAGYPDDLFAWGDAIGADRLVGVLDAIGAEYGDGRHRPSPLLRARARAGIALASALVQPEQAQPEARLEPAQLEQARLDQAQPEQAPA